MAINIIKEPDVNVTEGDLARYRAEYESFMRYYAGPPITLEEYIRRQRTRRREELDEGTRMVPPSLKE